MTLYGIMQEVEDFIDLKRNRRYLFENERAWVFEQRNLWEAERTFALMEQRNPVRYLVINPI
jgi:hypothetical protein